MPQLVSQPTELRTIGCVWLRTRGLGKSATRKTFELRPPRGRASVKQTVGASRLARRSISNGWWGEYSFDLSAALHMALLSQHVLPGRHALRIALQSSKVASSKARFSTESSVANTSQRWWTPFCSLSRSRETRKQLRSRQLSHNHPDFLGLPASKVHQPRVLRLESSEWP